MTSHLSHRRGSLIATAVVAFAAPALADDLVIIDSFDPSKAGSLCSAGYDGSVWVYGCSTADVQAYATDGTFLGSIPRPGESANDVDIDTAPIDFTLGEIDVSAGTLLFINGESGTADIYAVDPVTGDVLATLTTVFGNSHVVGGAFHADRGTLFLLQDQVPGAAGNVIAEIDPIDGTVLNSFPVNIDGFSVNFGDMDVNPATGNILVVSSTQSTITEFAPTGEPLGPKTLPAGVGTLSGIAMDETGCTAWVAGTNGTVWHLRLASCPADTDQNGVVDVVDLVNVILAWATDDAAADTNDDGLVDVLDLIEVILNWGECACEAG